VYQLPSGSELKVLVIVVANIGIAAGNTITVLTTIVSKNMRKYDKAALATMTTNSNPEI
jgi:hypothetical protein